MPGDSVLSRDDIFLLMEAYRNNIELSTTLLQQQKQIIEQLQKNTTHQEKICNSIHNVANKLDTCADELRTAHQNTILTKTKDRADCAKEHGSIVSRINLVYVGIGALVIPLIGLIIETYDKLELVHHIAQKLGVG